MSPDSRTRWFQFAIVATLAALTAATPGFAQPTSKPHTFVAPADGNSYTVIVAGGDPFSSSPSATTIHAVLVPIIVEALDRDGETKATFDAFGPDFCDSLALPAWMRFLASPLVQKSDLKFNGVDVGTVQFSTGFKRAEFWNMPGGRLVDDTLVWTMAPPVIVKASIPTGEVIIYQDPGNPCTQGQARLSQTFLTDHLTDTVIPELQKSSVITTSDLVFFLTDNVVQSGATPAANSPCCSNGFNGRSEGQGWAWANYDSFGGTDIKTSSHEIGEWTNSPKGNTSPTWGNIGEAKTCDDTQFQVGDPLNTAPTIPITINGFTYHLAELAYFGWFYDAPIETWADLASPYMGLGGFSSNGTFVGGPHKACPTGGTSNWF
jgi:hypothetical protein